MISAVVLVRRIHFVARDWKIQSLSLANSQLKIRLGFDLLGRSVHPPLSVQTFRVRSRSSTVDPLHYIMPFHDSNDEEEGWSTMKTRLSEHRPIGRVEGSTPAKIPLLFFFFFFFGVVTRTECAGILTLQDIIVHLEEMLYALAASTALCGTPRAGSAQASPVASLRMPRYTH